MNSHSITRVFAGIFVVLGTLLLAPAAAGETALDDTPVVVAFDAVISEIEGDAQPLDLPFNLSIGDHIEGEIAFDSREEALSILGGNLTLFADLELRLGGSTIENLFNLGTVNSGPFPGPIDLPPAEPPSSIFFAYFPASIGTPGWVGSGLGVPWNAEIWMVGEPGTIEIPAGLLDFNDWNRLETVRNLTIQFGFPDTVTVTATLGDFTAVPEPSSLALAAFAFVGVVSRVISRHGQSRPVNSCLPAWGNRTSQ